MQPQPPSGFYLDGEPHVDPRRLVEHYCAQRGFGVDELGIKPVVLATFGRELARYLADIAGAVRAERWSTWRGDGFVAGDALTIVTFPIGAPATVAMFEEMTACGMRTLITTGSAGSLQPDAPIGSIVVPTSAIREEGTSHHYAPHDEPAEADSGLVAGLRAALGERNIPYREGVNWTTDAIYREHRQKVDLYRRAGVVTVDMEMSALFTVARFRGVRCAAIVAVSDELHGESWDLGFGREDFVRSMTKAGRVALTVAQQQANLTPAPSPQTASGDDPAPLRWGRGDRRDES
jgi:uridine phosphorylase